jgi:anaphase-promoting complex subunit 4
LTIGLSKLTLCEREQNTDDAISTYMITSSTSQPEQLNIHRVTHAPTITALPKNLHHYAATTVEFPAGSNVVDAKFADDEKLLVLLSTSEDGKDEPTCILLSIPYTTLPSLSPPQHPIPYTLLSPSVHASLTLPHGSPAPLSSRTIFPITSEAVKTHTKHVFERRFTPLKLVVNGRKGRRVAVVLGSDCKHYRVLDLDFRARAKEGVEVLEDGTSSDEDSDIEMVGV